MTTVMLCDPDSVARRRVAAALRFSGYSVETATTPASTRSRLRRRKVSAVIIDPAGDIEAVTALRALSDIPIIVISASAAEWDKVAMLDAGADDYMTKPYGLDELRARVRVALRRRAPARAPAQPPIATADFTVDVADRKWLPADGREVRLTPTEWRLVELLTRHPGRLVPQAELLLGIWGPKAIDKTAYLRVLLTGIRHKIEPEPARPRYFITAPGLGLRFNADARQLSETC